MVEQEMKIPVGAHDAVRRYLVERGGRRVHPLALEDNLVLDDARGTLAAASLLLRLRRFGGRSTLTFKGVASFTAGVKSRAEHETTVEDGDAALAILAGLGFTPVRRYLKRREVWMLDQVTVALDETPMGAFVELEGEGGRLAAVAGELHLDPSVAARGTYLELWAAFRAAHPDAPEDMVFTDPAAGRPRAGSP